MVPTLYTHSALIFRSESTHIFAITSPPGGVHIFACLGSFRNLRPNLAYFRILPPYRYILYGYALYLTSSLSVGAHAHINKSKFTKHATIVYSNA